MEEQSYKTIEAEQGYEEVKDTINYDQLCGCIKKLEQKHQKLQSDRRARNDKWLQVLQGASEGTLLESTLKSLMTYVMDVEDIAYPSLVWQSYAEKMGLLTRDIIELEPRGKRASTQGDLLLADSVAEFIKQKYQHSESCFRSAFKAAIWTAVSINLGIVHYCWNRKVVKKKQQQACMDDRGGYVLRTVSQSDELNYQGAKATFVNPFNFYFDTNSGRIDNLYELNTFYTDIVSFDQACKAADYDPNQLYYNEENVIWRDNTKLKELKDPKVELSDIEQRQRQLVNQENPTFERSIKLVTAHVKCFKLEDTIYEDVVIRYALGECGEDPIPLNIEYNPQPFNWKPYVYIVPRRVPTQVYSKSQTELAYNHFALTHYYQGIEMVTSAEAVFGTEFYPSQLPDSMGESDTEFDTMLNTVGRRVQYDSEGYRNNGADIFSPHRDRAAKVLPLVQQLAAQARQAQTEAHVDLQNADVADSTATGVKAVAAKRDLVQDFFEEELQDAVERFTKMMLADMKVLFTGETLVMDMSQDEMKALMHDDVTENTSFTAESVTSANVPFAVQYDPLTQKKIIDLQSFLLTDFEGEVKVVLKDKSINAAMEEIGQLYDLAEKFENEAVLMFALERYVQTTDMPQGQELLEEVKRQIEAKAQPSPEQQMQVQAEMMKTQADTKEKEANVRLKNAQAAEELSRASTQTGMV